MYIYMYVYTGFAKVNTFLTEDELYSLLWPMPDDFTCQEENSIRESVNQV